MKKFTYLSSKKSIALKLIEDLGVERMKLSVERFHTKYGCAILIKNNIDVVKSINTYTNDIEILLVVTVQSPQYINYRIQHFNTPNEIRKT